MKAALSAPAAGAVCAPGCGRGDPNQFVSGTMVKPLESVELADEIRAKKNEAILRGKGSRTKKRR
jgi:hypothetical protein